MRYFWIHADKSDPQPRCLGWASLVRPGCRPGHQVYRALKKDSHLNVELSGGCLFPDILCHPCFMVSKDFADLIRLYRPQTRFKNMYLFDREGQRTGAYLIPDLPEIDCLHEDSELSRDKDEIKRGVLVGERIKGLPIFQLGQVGTQYIVASLEFVESAYRREVRGMRIEGFRVS